MLRCRVTHPFHPWKGRVLEIFEHRRDWCGDWVHFHAELGCLRSLPARSTSVVPSDPYEVLGAGRARFRVEDLLGLVEMLDGLQALHASQRGRR